MLVMLMQNPVLHENFALRLSIKHDGYSAQANILTRLGEVMKYSTLINNDEDRDAAFEKNSISNVAPQIQALINSVQHPESFVTEMKKTVNHLSVLVESGNIEECASQLVSLSYAMSFLDDDALSPLISAHASLQRHIGFVEKSGGPSMLQLNESQWMRLFQAGAACVAVKKQNDQTMSIFFAEDRCTEVGRYIAHTASDEHDAYFTLDKKLNTNVDEVITPIPTNVFNLKLARELSRVLSVENSPSSTIADNFVKTCKWNGVSDKVKTGFSSAASAAAYIYMKKQIDHGNPEAYSTLAYIAHYFDHPTSHVLMQSISSIPMQMQADHTVNRGAVNLSQSLSADMEAAKEVFSRRNACIERLQGVLNNSAFSSDEKITVMAKTLHFTDDAIAGWVGHLVSTEKPVKQDSISHRQTMSI